MFIWIFIAGIANLFYNFEWKKVDEQTVENRIEVYRSEAEKYEFTHKSFLFFIFLNLYFYGDTSIRQVMMRKIVCDKKSELIEVYLRLSAVRQFMTNLDSLLPHV